MITCGWQSVAKGTHLISKEGYSNEINESISCNVADSFNSKSPQRAIQGHLGT